MKPYENFPKGANVVLEYITLSWARPRIKNPIQSPPHSPFKYEEDGKDIEDEEEYGPDEKNNEGDDGLKIESLTMMVLKMRSRVRVSQVIP